MRNSIKFTIYLQICSMLLCWVIFFKIKKERTTSLINFVCKPSNCFLHSYRHTSRKTNEFEFTIWWALRLKCPHFIRSHWIPPNILCSTHKTIDIESKYIFIILIQILWLFSMLYWSKDNFIILTMNKRDFSVLKTSSAFFKIL